MTGENLESANILVSIIDSFDFEYNNKKMSTDYIERKILKDLDNKVKICYNCKRRGHSKFECKQGLPLTRTERHRNRDEHISTMILEGIPIADNIDLDLVIKQLCKVLHIKGKLDEFTLTRPWSHYLRKNDILITFKDDDLKKDFLSAIENQKSFIQNHYIYSYSHVNRGLATKIANKNYELLFRDVLPYQVDKMYTKALELKDRYGIEYITFAGQNQDKIVARKREFSYYYCKDLDDLKRLENDLRKIKLYDVTRKRRLLTIAPRNYTKA